MMSVQKFIKIMKIHVTFFKGKILDYKIKLMNM